jgi:lia operon protein LiaG
MDVKVEIKVPAQFNLDISTAGGDVKCGGITGKAELNTSGGDVWADKFSGDLNASTSGGDIFLFCTDTKIIAETSGGDVNLEYEGENKGIDLSTSGGDIDIILSKDFAASMELSTSGGDVSCSLNMSNVKKSSGSRLIGDLNDGGEKLYAHTSGGDITVTEK